MTGLSGQLAALARTVAGEIGEVADRSWQREGSAVWQIADAAGGCWFVKRHSSERFHQREVSAYRHWTAALGPGRAPDLAAADSQMLAIVISGLPGQIALNLRLAADDEREMHRQAGELLRRLHNTAPPVPGCPGLGRAVQRVDEHLSRTGALLTSSEITLVRRCAAELASLAPELPAVPTHGDAQLRNWLWNRATRLLAMIDFERAETGPAVRDLVRLEYGPWDQRPDLRASFLDGYGRALTHAEEQALPRLAALDALSGLQWGTANGDREVADRARKTFARLRVRSP
ncbi:MAG TPA: aminoglycoside phosphotransferase family protein [Streptosporangiaceae bacterium]|nr:aminoglycoside phosphotransferase family protein [Streptosporangiaceae bacterium]